MAENKKSFLLYADLLKNIEHLTNEEKGVLFNHLLEYVNDKNPILEDRLILTAWKPIEAQLKRDLREWEEVQKERSNQGKIGNLKRWNQDLYDKYISEEISLEDALEIANSRKASPPDSPLSPPYPTPSLPIANIAVNGTVTVNDTVNGIKENTNTKKEVREAAPKHKLSIWLDNNCPTVQKMKEPITNEQAERIVAEFKHDVITETFTSMENRLTLLKDYKSANLTVRKWIKLSEEKQQANLSQFKPPIPTMTIKPTGTMQKLQEMDEKYPNPTIKS